MVKFCPIASSSDGNCLYVGSEHTNILIDAGLSGKKIEEGLSTININAETLDGIFVTHEHSDHIKGVGVLSRRYNLPIFATEGTWAAMESSIGTIHKKNKKIIYENEKFSFNDLIVSPFSIPHDAEQPVGYSVFIDDKKVSVATDIGHINDSVKEGIANSDIILLESNHDVYMVKTGGYPYHLKQRILGDFGHLSNENAGKLLCEIASSKLKHIVLGHLSKENNTTHLAYKVVNDILYNNKLKSNKDFSLEIACQNTVNRYIRID